MLMLLQAFNVNDDADGHIRFVINPQILLEHLSRACKNIKLDQHAAAFDRFREEGNYDPQRVKEYIAMMQFGFAQAEPAVAG
jgi:hypothetical protein